MTADRISGALGSALDAQVGCSETLGSAPDARAYFFLSRQEKVAKKKATPRSTPGFARSLALLGSPGVSLNSPAAQTTRADCPRPACVAQRLPGGPGRASQLHHLPSFPRRRESRDAREAVPAVLDSHFRGNDVAGVQRPFGVRGPLGGAEQRRVVGGSRLALSEARRAEFSETPDCPSSAGDPAQRGADPGSPSSLATFFLARQEESTPARQARKPAPKGAPAGQRRNPAPQKSLHASQRWKPALQKPPKGVTP
jgi:hypothetical protein